MLYALIDYSNKKSIRKIDIEEVLGEVKVAIPKFKEKHSKKVAKKILKMINEHKVENIVLSKELSKNNEFCSTLKENKKYIITGRRISKVVLDQLLKDISKYSKYPKEKMNVLLLMNEYSLENIDLIEVISKEVRQLHVISRNYSKYEKCANSLFENYGYMVKLYSNEYSGEFNRVNVVLNVDFKEEELQKIVIAKNSVVVSLNERINKVKRGFNGIIINDIDVAGFDENLKNYRGLAICEAKVYKPLRNIIDNERIFNQEKYIINGYTGLKGKITEEEFEKMGKNFT